MVSVWRTVTLDVSRAWRLNLDHGARRTQRHDEALHRFALLPLDAETRVFGGEPHAFALERLGPGTTESLFPSCFCLSAAGKQQ